ncbi:MAG: PIN domain-containing protein [Alphaproteobacteria bacterium]|nr:PIN domain-containing protein [Alphaproteobacteria bacterium]
MTEVILDSSAVLALLNDEKGAEVVRGLLEEAVISAVNLAEVLTVLSDGGLSDSDAAAALAELDIEVVAFDALAAGAVASLRPTTKSAGLSLGDRACLALARHRKVKAITGDRAWMRLKLPIEIDIIR